MIIDTNCGKKFSQSEISESDLRRMLIKNFEVAFPNFEIIEPESTLKGDVRQFGVSGRIDILAFDSQNTRLVIFELKKVHSKNILLQALDYSDFIAHHIELIIPKIAGFPKEKIIKLISSKQEPSF